MKYRNSIIRFALVSVLLLAASGCGGGGGSGGGSGDDPDDDSDTTTGSEVEIDSSNGESVAKTTAVGAASIGQSGAQLTQAQIVGAADIDGGSSDMSVAEATHFVILQARDQAGDAIDAVTGATTSFNCDSGSASITDSGGTDGVLEQGDNWSATWNNCEFGFSGSGTSFSFLLDGQVEFAVTDCDNCDNASDDGADWGYGIEISYTDWLIQASQNGTPTVDILFDGSLTLSALNSTADGTLTFNVNGGPFSITDNLNGNDFEYVALDIEHEINTSSGSYTTIVNEITLTSSQMNGQVTASTQPGDPFKGDGAFPTSGTLVINGANGLSAIVDAGQCGPDEYDLVINGSGEGCQPWTDGV